MRSSYGSYLTEKQSSLKKKFPIPSLTGRRLPCLSYTNTFYNHYTKYTKRLANIASRRHFIHTSLYMNRVLFEKTLKPILTFTWVCFVHKPIRSETVLKVNGEIIRQNISCDLNSIVKGLVCLSLHGYNP